jgi:cholesterol transport system auxiliary component
MKLPGLRTLPLFAAAAITSSLLLACASGPAPRDHYYRLSVGAPAALAGPVVNGAVEVDRVRVESISQGRRILYREAANPGEIAQHAYHHWTDPPNVMLQEQLVAYLRAAGAAEGILTPAVHVETAYQVGGRLILFERVLGTGSAKVVVELELVLTRTADRELLVLDTYREERTAAGPGVAESVEAFDAAVTSIFERFLADIPRS